MAPRGTAGVVKVGSPKHYRGGQRRAVCEWATTPHLDATVTTSAPIATFDVVKLFHRTLADAREMIAQTFLVAVDQSRE
jgi:hypothetical protein